MSFIKLGDLLKSAEIASQGSTTGAIDYSKLFNSHIKPVTIYESTIDLLALSVCWKRLRGSQDPGRYYINSLLDPQLGNFVSIADLDEAEKIRDYYSKKLMVLTLRGDSPLTKFRKDLSSFVSSDGLSFREEFVPLAFRLPELYEYDLKLEDIFALGSETDFVSSTQDDYQYLGKLFRNVRKLKRYEYWFVDATKMMTCFSVDTTNSLLPIWDGYITHSPKGIVSIKGNKIYRKRDNFSYLEFTKLA